MSVPECATPECPYWGIWRISSTIDPWPLAYACDEHLPAAIRSFPLPHAGAVKVSIVRPGEPTPEPRRPDA
jgi:hypothetical protein